MSERDLKRIEVLSDVRAGRRTVAAAAGILERSSVSQELGGKYIDLYHFSDGRLELRSNGRVLPYRVFDKDQRVSPAAVVENKRLGHALSRIKLQQDTRLAQK